MLSNYLFMETIPEISDFKNGRLQNSPYFCVFKYARAVKQKVWNKAVNRERDSYATLYRFLYWFWEKNRLFCSLQKWMNFLLSIVNSKVVFLHWLLLHISHFSETAEENCLEENHTEADHSDDSVRVKIADLGNACWVVSSCKLARKTASFLILDHLLHLSYSVPDVQFVGTSKEMWGR